MTIIKYIFVDSLSDGHVNQCQRQYWYEKLHLYRRELIRQRRLSRYDGDIEAIKRFDKVLNGVDELLEKCRENTEIFIAVRADEVTVLDMQKSVAMIQKEIGILEND